MDTAEEDTANQNPQQAGQPAEHGSGDGAGNGAGTGDGGEVVTHQHGGLSRHIVDSILHGVCGGRLVVFTNAPLLAQVATVEDVAAEENGNSDNEKYKTVHKICLLPSFHFFPEPKFCSRFFRALRPAGLDRKLLVDASIAAT